MGSRRHSPVPLAASSPADAPDLASGSASGSACARGAEALPALPDIRLTTRRDLPSSGPGFLSVRRVEFAARYPDGSESEPFVHDMVLRRALDAIVVVAHFRPSAGGARRVYLRSCVRPPVFERPIAPPHEAHGNFWELPAGLIDPGETPVEAAARETEEELGFVLPPAAFLPLGPHTFPASGLVPEHHYFFHVEVDPAARRTPSEDGSPLERAASVVDVGLDVALAACRAGSLRDAKTELGLRRFEELP